MTAAATAAADPFPSLCYNGAMLTIGSLTLNERALLAPMAGLTDNVFRRFLSEIGSVGAMITEMISAEGLRRRNRRTWEMVQPIATPIPQFIQIFGAEPEAMAEAARLISGELAYAGLDLNMGCPAVKVTRTGAGAALLADKRKMAAVLRAVRRSTALPLNVKIRLGVKRVEVSDLARLAEDEGADAVTVHFRLKGDSYRVPARWEYAAELSGRLRIPVIGNGDIDSAAAAQQKLALVDGVMIGRGALADPFIFKRIAGGAVDRAETAQRFARLCELIVEQYPAERRLHRLKAYSRYLDLGLKITHSHRRPVFRAEDFSSACQCWRELIERAPER